MDHPTRPLLPPNFGLVPGVLAVVVALGIPAVLGGGLLPFGNIPAWKGLGHGVLLALFILLADDARRYARWRREAGELESGKYAWAIQALRLCQERAKGHGPSALLRELTALRDELSRSLTTRWAVRYAILACLPVIVGFVDGMLSLDTLLAQNKRYVDIFKPTLIGSAETLVVGAAAYLMRISWEDVINAWYAAVAEPEDPRSSSPDRHSAPPSPVAEEDAPDAGDAVTRARDQSRSTRVILPAVSPGSVTRSPPSSTPAHQPVKVARHSKRPPSEPDKNADRNGTSGDFVPDPAT